MRLDAHRHDIDRWCIKTPLPLSIILRTSSSDRAMHEMSSHNLDQASSTMAKRALDAGSARPSGPRCRNARTSDRSQRSFSVTLCLTMLIASALSGCAAVRPLDGVPARFLPEELPNTWSIRATSWRFTSRASLGSASSRRSISRSTQLNRPRSGIH